MGSTRQTPAAPTVIGHWQGTIDANATLALDADETVVTGTISGSGFSGEAVTLAKQGS